MAKQTWKGGKLLLDLADFLENDPRVKGHFDMEIVLGIRTGDRYKLNELTLGDRQPDLHSCGTAACAMGWAPHVPSIKRAGLRYARSSTGNWRLVFKYASDFDDTAMRLFDIEQKHCDDLFYMRDDNRGPVEVARNIRRFVTAERKRRGINADA